LPQTFLLAAEVVVTATTPPRQHAFWICSFADKNIAADKEGAAGLAHASRKTARPRLHLITA